MATGETTILIAADQLSPWNSALAGTDPARTTVLMIESLERLRRRPYHKRRLALEIAAMRGFADDLRAAGRRVEYHSECDDAGTALARHAATHRPAAARAMMQSDFGESEPLSAAFTALGIPLEITPHTNFISTAAEFAQLFERGQARVTMETFYRRMRRKTGLLMEGSEPVGGAWNFDAENRRPPKRAMQFPPEPRLAHGPHVRAALDLVERRFPANPGTLRDFDLPTTRAEALAYADDFFAHRLDGFGPYEDAMLRGEARLYHSRLSAPINLGLLHPLELCERAERAYRSGAARLASVEGFVRQLIGWREFVWQTYWRLMPEYRTRNALGAELPLPAWYRDGETQMNCQREALRHVLDLGWAHHIERLMILGNFALLAGCEPQAITDWFWYMFVDGYDWVMVPNVVGMTLHADGGFVGTKPYAASANYINTMSDYCGGCAYDAKKVVGDNACPYNSLYWDFIARNESRFARNPRMALPLRNWRAKDADVRRDIRARAEHLLQRLRGGGTL